MVKCYLEEGNVGRIFAKMLPSKILNKVGAQIIVAEDDVDYVLDSNFWPPGVYARKWEPRQRSQKREVFKSVSLLYILLFASVNSFVSIISGNFCYHICL